MSSEEIDERIERARVLLNAVRVLHLRGAHRVQIFPHMSPSGAYWRCPIVIDGTDPFADPSNQELAYSSANSWKLPGCAAEEPINSLRAANALWKTLTEDQQKKSVVPDPAYVRWYGGLLNYLCDDEVPYLFGDDYGSSPLKDGVMGQAHSYLRNDYPLPPGNSLAWH